MTKELTGVRAKLAAYKEQNEGTHELTLKRSGIVCTVPNFINHGRWMAAQKIGRNDLASTQVAFVCETIRFEGEKLTQADARELVCAADMMQLIGEVFDNEDDKAGDDLDDGEDSEPGKSGATVQ